MSKLKILSLLALAGSALMTSQAFATSCPLSSIGVQTLAGPVCLAPYGSDGQNTGLQNILGPAGTQNSIVSSGPGFNVYNNQLLSSYWTITASGASVNDILLQLSSYAGNDTFGIYQPGDPSNSLVLFSPGTTSATGAQTLLSYNSNTGTYVATYFTGPGGTYLGQSSLQMNSSSFGFFLTTPNNTFYSDPTLNETSNTYPNGTPHQIAYACNGSNTITTSSFSGVCGGNEYIMAWEDLPFASSDLDYQDFIVLIESVRPVPEPGVLAMFGLGVLLIGVFTGLRRRHSVK